MLFLAIVTKYLSSDKSSSIHQRHPGVTHDSFLHPEIRISECYSYSSFLSDKSKIKNNAETPHPYNIVSWANPEAKIDKNQSQNNLQKRV